MATKFTHTKARVLPIEGGEQLSLTLDIKKKRVSMSPVEVAEPSATLPGQAILIPEVDARENYDPIYRLAKRTIDVAFALFVLTMVAPFFAFIAVSIKLSSRGPVFYMQERTGKSGRRFMMYKFRTMRDGSEELKKALEKKSHLTFPDFKLRNDPRVTKIGRILRKLSLDELPNFINVLRGEMSLVGPRPTSFRPEVYKDWQKLRLKATPGLTGLQQVSGRANLQFDERVLFDIKYILYQSLTLDLYILARTVFVVLTTKGSY
jgi:lipopolysaccharide/colanic/teichoic acid biosynthesis glycosyltransferase